jgi:hypothetical protein
MNVKRFQLLIISNKPKMTNRRGQLKNAKLKDVWNVTQKLAV